MTPQTKISAMNIYSIDKLKALAKNDFMISVPKTSSLSSSSCCLEFDSRF